jgi:hypothetical protein
MATIDDNLVVARICTPDQNCTFTFTLASRTGEILEEVEDRYGQSDRSFTLLGIECCEQVPQIWFPGNHGKIIIQLILSCFKDETIDPVEASDTCHFLRGLFQGGQSFHKDTFDCIQALEDLVWEPLFTDLFPEVLYGIEFRAIWWQEDDPHIRGNLEVLGSGHPALSITMRMKSLG